MPHMNAASGEDLACTDEVKVYKDEGEEEEQQKSSENLTEDKVGLVIEGEGQTPLEFDFQKNGNDPVVKVPFAATDPRFAGYFLSPYPSYTNGAHPGFGTKVPFMPTVPSPFSFMSIYDAFAQPPPAHRSPLADPKTGLPTPLYAIQTASPGHQLSPFYSADLAAAAAAWVGSPPSSAANVAALRASPYAGMSAAQSSMPYTGGSPMAMQFSPSMLAAAAAFHPTFHPAAHVQFLSSLTSSVASTPPTTSATVSLPPSSTPQPSQSTELHHCVTPSMTNQNVAPVVTAAAPSSKSTTSSTTSGGQTPAKTAVTKTASSQQQCSGSTASQSSKDSDSEKMRRSHIKKPLNAFMLFMKEMRPHVQEECTLKESAAINQILGKKWHELAKDDQSKYYDMARREKEMHGQLYPGWSARDNYAMHSKRKKKRKSQGEGSAPGGDGGSDSGNPKKCRARYGLEQQNQWCKPCRRKKKCIRFLSDHDGDDDGIASDASPPQLTNHGDTSEGDMYLNNNGDDDDEEETGEEPNDTVNLTEITNPNKLYCLDLDSSSTVVHLKNTADSEHSSTPSRKKLKIDASESSVSQHSVIGPMPPLLNGQAMLPV